MDRKRLLLIAVLVALVIVSYRLFYACSDLYRAWKWGFIAMSLGALFLGAVTGVMYCSSKSDTK